MGVRFAEILGTPLLSLNQSRSALILAGGSGTRFWPLSRRKKPKQLLSLDGGPSLLQQTLGRLHGLLPEGKIWLSVTADLLDPIRREVPELPPERFLVEPVGRNTAPAIGAALLAMPPEVRQGTVAVLPADHRIADPPGFQRVLTAAFELVERTDRIVTLGIRPCRPETGFGYLELGAELEGDPRACEVVRFREKPDRATAEAFLRSGRHLWNGGIFVFRGERMLGELRCHAPELAAALEAYDAAAVDREERYAALPSISIDYAVMERTTGLAALELDCGWSDLGTWEALFEILPADGDGNCALGEALFLDTRNSLVVSPGATTVVLGVQDLVVVRTDDAVLVLPRSRSQEVRNVLAALEHRGRTELI